MDCRTTCFSFCVARSITPIVVVVRLHAFPSRSSVMVRADAYCATLSVGSSWRNWTCSDLKKELCKCEFGQLMDTLVTKPLHGKFQALLRSDEMDSNRSTCWLK